MMVSSLALLQTAAVVVLLNLGRHASASLFNFTDAARDWPDGWGRTPSDQACFTLKQSIPGRRVLGPFHRKSICATIPTHFAHNFAFGNLSKCSASTCLVCSLLQATINVQLLLSNQNRTEQLGRILQNSISRNQSFAVAEAVRFALLPNSGYNSDDPANAPTYNMLAANIGAATAYAMHNAAQLVSHLAYMPSNQQCATLMMMKLVNQTKPGDKLVSQQKGALEQKEPGLTPLHQCLFSVAF